MGAADLMGIKDQLDPNLMTSAVLPSGNQMLDQLERVFRLRQDVERCDDLESEERALVSLASQEYDALKILSTIPEGTELY